MKSLFELRKLDEMREPYAVVDTADGNKVVGTASDEKGAKSIITTAQLPPMKIKDKKTLKIVKTSKKQMIGQPIKEEVELEELTAAEKKLVDKMYDKKGNLTPFGKKVMAHKFPTNTSATQGKRMGVEGKAANPAQQAAIAIAKKEKEPVDESKKMDSDALKRAMDAFKKRGGKVKKVAPGKASGWHGKDDLGTDTHGVIGKSDTSKFKTKRGGKIKSMSADTQYDENYQVQKYTNGKKDGPAKSFGGDLKKATAHADKMGGDHRVHKVK